MKRKMSVFFKQMICAALILLLSGCWNARELDTLGIVMGIGIDQPPTEPDKVHVTVQLVKPGAISTSKNGGNGDGGKAFWNIGLTDETIFSAIREMTSMSSRKLFFPHNEIIVFGQGAAEDGIRKNLDCLVRDHESRSKVLVAVSETTAEEVLDVKPELEKIPATNMSNLIRQYEKATSQTIATTLSDLSKNLMSDTKSAVIPMLAIAREGDKETVEIAGTAVFKSDKMVGKLDKSESRGLLWVLGEVKSGVVVVKDRENNLVSIEIVRSKAQITPALEAGKIVIKIDVFEEGNLSEETGTATLTELPEVAFLEDGITEAIRSEITASIRKARELDADIFGFGEAVKGKYPGQWKEIADNWDEVFKTMKIELNVDANLRLAGKVAGPQAPEKG